MAKWSPANRDDSGGDTRDRGGIFVEMVADSKAVSGALSLWFMLIKTVVGNVIADL